MLRIRHRSQVRRALGKKQQWRGTIWNTKERYISACRRKRKKKSTKKTREPICGKLQKVNYVAGSREKQKVDAPPVKGKAPMMRLNGKSHPHSPPPPVSQFVSHSISPRTRIPRTTNSFGGRKKRSPQSPRKMKPPAAGGQPLTAGNHLNYMPAASLVGYRHPPSCLC